MAAAVKDKPKRKPKRKPNKAETAEAYAARLAWQSDANQKASKAFRNIGKIPKPKNGRRRGAAKRSLKRFCEVYQAETFSLAWSEDHIRVIKKLERAIREGGLFALAMPRASGKTSLVEAAALWALLFGFRRFVVLIGATETHASDLLDSIATEIRSNDLLLEDFPEVCLPIRRLDGNPAKRLNCEGDRITITISAKEIILPWIHGGKNAPSAGAVLQVRGITGAIRGMKAKLPDGRTIRPDFVIPDDPQTDESATSPSQTEKRIRKIAQGVLGLAEPGKKISAVMPCTVIEEGDLADELLNPELHPDWQGERISLLPAFPERMDLWREYGELRDRSLRARGDISMATEFYAENRSLMDLGASVMWQGRQNVDELSAIQNAMNLFLADERSFWFEYQNEARPVVDSDDLRLQSATSIAARVNGLDRGRCLPGVETITGFVDIQKRVLFYTLVGWRADFTGSVLEYGTFPDQLRSYFTLDELTKSLQDKFPTAAGSSAIMAGLKEFVPSLLGRKFDREDDGVTLSPSLILIDANYETSTVRDAYKLIGSQNVYPAHGRFVGATNTPVNEYKRKAKAERYGLNWKSSIIERVPHIVFDSNYWKGFLHDRFSTDFGDPSSLTFFGRDPKVHRMISEHLSAEFRIKVTASTGREAEEWKLKATKPDNHFLDCLSGSAVAASIMGVTIPGLEPTRRPKSRRRRVSYH